jgi:hypothetical protein
VWICQLLIVVTLTTFCATAQNLPSCDELKVQYSPFDKRYDTRMAVSTSTPKTATPANRSASPQAMRWYFLSSPDFTKPGPWVSTLHIGSAGQGPSVVITFRDHSNNPVDVKWLNEKLLYGSVWWGRIVSTDFVFDVEKHAFLYREMANYGQLTESCE